jgi:hypothetical protein
LLAGQPKREPHTFCSDGKSCGLGGRCRLSSTRIGKRTREALGRVGNGLGNLAPNNSVLRRMSHLKLASNTTASQPAL